MQRSRIGHLHVELAMTDELRQKLMELATGSAETVVIPMAMMRHVRVHHLQSDATRVRELFYRRIAVDRLEISSGSGPM